MAATASPNLADQALLANDTGFVSRVKEALAATCNNVSSEAVTGLTGNMPIQLHTLRARQASTILNNLNNGSLNWAQTFAFAVATDATTIAAATASGATPLTAGNVATQAAAIADTNLVNAVSAMFNNFLTLA